MDLKWGHHPQDRIYRIWNSQTLDAPKIRSSFSLYVPGWFTRTFQEIKSVEEEDFRDSGSKQFNTHAMKKKKIPTSPLNIIYRTGLKSPFPSPSARHALDFGKLLVTVTRGCLRTFIAKCSGWPGRKRGDVCMHEGDEKEVRRTS